MPVSKLHDFFGFCALCLVKIINTFKGREGVICSYLPHGYDIIITVFTLFASFLRHISEMNINSSQLHFLLMH